MENALYYSPPQGEFWSGRIDEEPDTLTKRWYHHVRFLPYPYQSSYSRQLYVRSHHATHAKKSTSLETRSNDNCAVPGIVLLGFASDEGVRRNQGRIGAAQSPDVLKQALGNFAFHLKNCKLYDAGNIVVTDHLLEEAQTYLAAHIEILLNKGHLPIILGGGHEVAYPSFLGLFNALQTQDPNHPDRTQQKSKPQRKSHQLSKYQESALQNSIAILNFDAHFDLRDHRQATSGTPFRQIATLCSHHHTPFHYKCLGISQAANTQALFKTAAALKVPYILDTQMTYHNLSNIKQQLDTFLKASNYIYITIDADVFAPYIVPAVSAPAARGISLNVTFDILQHLFTHYRHQIRLVDIAEFNPTYDIHNMGRNAIARLVYDLVSLAAEQGNTH